MGFLAPKQEVTQTGPRLQQLNGVTSAYGDPRPIIFGTVRIGCNAIWTAPEVTQIENIETFSSGGKGLFAPTTDTTSITYTNFLDIAFGIGEHEAVDLLAMWNAGQIIMNRAAGRDYFTWPGLDWVFYTGAADQIPDPTIAADVDVRIGPDMTPAYRGTCYLVFKQFPLTDFGDTFPQMTVEVSYKPTTGDPVNINSIDLDSDTTGGNGLNGTIFWDRYAKIALGTGSFGPGAPAADLSDPANPVYLGATDVSGTRFGFDGFHGYCDIAGMLAAQIETGGDEGIGGWFDPISGAVLLRKEYDEDELPFALQPTGHLCEWLSGPTGTYVAAFGIIGTNLVAMDGLSLSVVSVFDLADLYTFQEGPIFMRAIPGVGQFHFWVSDDEAGADINIVTIDFVPTSFSNWTVINLTVLDFQADATGVANNGWHCVYHIATDAFLVWCQTEGGANPGWYTARVERDGSIIWVVSSYSNSSSPRDDNTLTGTTYAWRNSALTIASIDARTGTIGDVPFDGTTVLSSARAPTKSFFDADLGCMIEQGGQGVELFCPNTFDPENVAIADIVNGLGGRVDVTAGTDSDTSQLTVPFYTVRGLIFDGASEADSVVVPLGNLFQFGRVERDQKLVYVPHGTTSAATIPEDDFVVTRRDGVQFEQRRLPEVDLPVTVEVRFSDPDLDYQANVARVQRIRLPIATVSSNSTLPIDSPAIQQATKVKQLTERKMVQAWVERDQYTMRLSQKYLELDPTDVVTFTLNNGWTFDARIEEFDISDDFRIEIRAVQIATGQYTSSTVEADTGDASFSGGGLPFTSQPTDLILFDPPLLDNAAVGDGTHAYVYAAAGNNADGYRGNTVVRSPEDVTWTQVATNLTAATYGSVDTALPDPGPHAFDVDTDTVLTVDIIDGAENMASVTDAQLDAGQNAAALIREDGEVEIIQYRDVVDNGDNTFDLSYLYRGRRGSDTMVRTATTREQFVRLTPQLISPVQLPTTSFGVDFNYRAVNVGNIIANSGTQIENFEGRGMMPYYPADVVATLTGADIVFTWEARDRRAINQLNGDQTLGSDPTEEYQIDIYHMDAVIRTLSVTDATTATYYSGDQQADNTQALHLLRYNLYKINTNYPLNGGRGFTWDTLEPIRDIGVGLGNNVQALLLFEGTDGQTTTVDSSPHARAVVMENGASIDTDNPLTGVSSMLRNGTTQQTRIDYSSAFNPVGAWSIECWIHPTALPNQARLVSFWGTGGKRSWYLYTNGTDIAIRLSNDGTSSNTFGSLSDPFITVDQRQHILYVFDGIDTHRFFVDGQLVLKNSTIAPAYSNVPDTTEFVICDDGTSFLGHIDAVRYIVGEPLWHLSDDSFTPPVTYP